MTHDVDFLFIRFFGICLSSLLRCLFEALAHFLIRLFSNYWVFDNSLYSLDINPLSDFFFFVNIFSQTVTYFSILFILIFFFFFFRLYFLSIHLLVKYSLYTLDNNKTESISNLL